MRPTSSALPGEELVTQGLKDLAAGKITEDALLVLIASPKLQRFGIVIPNVAVPEPYEHQLYSLLSARFGNAAHSRYNSLLRRIVSYAHALAHEQRASRDV